MLEEPNMVREKFFNMKSREDVADILGIKEKSLRYFLYSIKPDNMYVEFSISKKPANKSQVLFSRFLKLFVNLFLCTIRRPALYPAYTKS